jgi:hypothetical protein
MGHPRPAVVSLKQRDYRRTSNARIFPRKAQFAGFAIDAERCNAVAVLVARKQKAPARVDCEVAWIVTHRRGFADELWIAIICD